MNRSTRWCALALALAALALPASASAQDSFTYRLGVLGGIGGSADADDNDELSQKALQLSFGMITNVRTLAVVRAGRIEFDEPIQGLSGAELEYINIAGEYRFHQLYYDFGLFLGLGSYRLSGRLPGGGDSESALGATFGVLGDFDLTRHLALTAEASAHYAFFDDRPNVYLTALGGLAIRF